jgi:short-subunit dehydrogenase
VAALNDVAVRKDVAAPNDDAALKTMQPIETVQPLDGYALVTGATAGIGAAFCRRLAAEGRDLVLVARDLARLDRTAAELRDRYPIRIEVLSADLSTEAGCAAVAARIGQDEKPVDSLINNAGFGLNRPFGEAPLADEEQMLNLNVLAVLRLTHAAVSAMTVRGRGEIINISSVAGFMPGGGAATYAASKAWVTSFSQGLASTLEGTGVTIIAICPGFTRTEFHEEHANGPSGVPSWMWLDANKVVAEGLAAARAGKSLSIPSRRYRVLVGLITLLPGAIVRKTLARG